MLLISHQPRRQLCLLGLTDNGVPDQGFLGMSQYFKSFGEVLHCFNFYPDAKNVKENDVINQRFQSITELKNLAEILQLIM